MSERDMRFGELGSTYVGRDDSHEDTSARQRSLSEFQVIV